MPDEKPDSSDKNNLDTEQADMLKLMNSAEEIMGKAIIGQIGESRSISDKIDNKAISAIIELNTKDQEYKYKDRESDRKYNFFYFVIGVFVFIFIIVFFTYSLLDNHPKVYEDLIKYAIAFIGGLGSGWGLKAYRDSKKSKE